MGSKISMGTLVDIEITILRAGERAPNIPEDTAAVDLKLRVKGMLQGEAAPGGDAEIETPVGRRLRGVLVSANPAYTHQYGTPIEELTPIGRELRAVLRQGRKPV